MYMDMYMIIPVFIESFILRIHRGRWCVLHTQDIQRIFVYLFIGDISPPLIIYTGEIGNVNAMCHGDDGFYFLYVEVCEIWEYLLNRIEISIDTIEDL